MATVVECRTGEIASCRILRLGSQKTTDPLKNSRVQVQRLVFHFAYVIKATSVRSVTLTAAALGSFLNFAQQAHMPEFKVKPKCAAVKVTPLTILL